MAGTMSADQDSNASWKDQAAFVPVVALLRKQMAPELSVLIDEAAPCFAWLWQDENKSVCPETGCDLRSYCQQAWQQVQVQRSARAKPAPKPKREAVVPPAPDKAPRAKWKGTGKYVRKGYEDLGRPVDGMVAAFYATLGKPPHLPPGWNPQNFDIKYLGMGDLVVSVTSSYHSVLHRGVTVARFWTNSPRRAIVDVVPELETILRVTAERVLVAESKSPHLTAPEPIHPGSLYKSRPCTHRVIVRSPAGAQRVAECVLKRFPLLSV